MIFRLCRVIPIQNFTSLFGLGQTIVAKKYRTGPKSIQTPVLFRPPAGRNPDWSITMILIEVTTQLIHCHILIYIIICYKPKENIVILLSPLELKSDFILVETPSSGVNYHHFISYERPSMQVKRQLHILFRNGLFHNDGGCFNSIRPGRRGLRGPDDQTHSCQSGTSYPMMPKLIDF